ncbi:MAG: diacylglycerol kinase [Spirochaetes bacterium]|nr:diacylglycerol kinase [Spirochaetota bacterium]
MKEIVTFFKYLGKYYESINFAIEGILQAAKTQKHVRLHLFAAAFLLLFCFSLGIEMNDFIILTMMASIVMVSEMLNSSIETVVDIISPEYSEKARIAKDIAAGAVFVAVIVALTVAYYILKPYFYGFAKEGLVLTKHADDDIAVGAIIIVLIVVIMLKSYFGKGHPLKGGLPSGHSALSFSIFVSSLYLSENFMLHVIILISAACISISRFILKIHNLLEVIAGIATGSLITFILYEMFGK